MHKSQWGGRRPGAGQKTGHPGYGGRPQIRIILRRGSQLTSSRTLKAGAAYTVTQLDANLITLQDANGKQFDLTVEHVPKD